MSRVVVFNTTFNNISVISWLLVLLLEETGVIPEKIIDLPQVTDKLYSNYSHNIVSSTPRHERYANTQLADEQYSELKINFEYIFTLKQYVINGLAIIT